MIRNLKIQNIVLGWSYITLQLSKSMKRSWEVESIVLCWCYILLVKVRVVIEVVWECEADSVHGFSVVQPPLCEESIEVVL